jgi:2-methylisocitrate lyase-like PEP mutase family enzyme
MPNSAPQKLGWCRSNGPEADNEVELATMVPAIEDQLMPKRCKHFPGKAHASTAERQRAVAAVVTASVDDGFLTMARTDAITVGGFESATGRTMAYQEVDTR